MTEQISNDYDTQTSLNVRTSGHVSPDAQKASLTVELPSEYWALISELSKDSGKDSDGKHRVLWAVDGIQSIDLSAGDRDKTMIFNIDAEYDLELFYKQMDVWLDDLRERRAAREVALRTAPQWHRRAMEKIARRSTIDVVELPES